jgi:sugar phosphate isomerase/epimerase
MYLAYTCFAVRMLQGRDILKSTAAALDADMFLKLCDRFGVSGAQVDFSQLPAGDVSSLARLRAAFEESGLEIELSIPARFLESPDEYSKAIAVAQALGARRARVALLYGRRYESFESRAAWDAFSANWHDTLPRMRPEFDRHHLSVAIENHKDWLARELVALVKAVDSPNLGVCVDFGNNLALLEDPDETIELLAPYAVTTHLKDMAVRRTEAGFELSEVPLGDGMLPLDRYIATLRRVRPGVPLCLEMITRDPLVVPYRTDRYWVAFDAAARDADRIRHFEDRILARAWDRSLPRTTGLSAPDQVTAEDDNVARCVHHAVDVLKLVAAS